MSSFLPCSSLLAPCLKTLRARSQPSHQLLRPQNPPRRPKASSFSSRHVNKAIFAHHSLPKTPSLQQPHIRLSRSPMEVTDTIRQLERCWEGRLVPSGLSCKWLFFRFLQLFKYCVHRWTKRQGLHWAIRIYIPYVPSPSKHLLSDFKASVVGCEEDLR